MVRQTDLVVAAAKTGKAVTLKKGQFLSPESMKFAVQKVLDSGNEKVAIIERGNSFGYTDLVVDFRGIPTMQNYAPVILDVTHSLQQPNQNSGVTGGRPELIETIAKAGIAAESLNVKVFFKNAGFLDSKSGDMEVVYDVDKKIVLGAFMIGYEAVAQFVDLISIVISKKIPIKEFMDFDYCYSPTNSVVWNPMLAIYRKLYKFIVTGKQIGRAHV